MLDHLADGVVSGGERDLADPGLAVHTQAQL